MRSRSFLPHAPAVFLLSLFFSFFLLVAHAPPAAALIVHEGRVVSAWPDQTASGATASGLRAAADPPTRSSFYTARRGEIHGLTILVDFSDTAPAFTVDQIKSWLLDPGYTQGGLNGSVRDYYLDQSNGMLDFRNDSRAWRSTCAFTRMPSASIPSAGTRSGRRWCTWSATPSITAWNPPRSAPAPASLREA